MRVRSAMRKAVGAMLRPLRAVTDRRRLERKRAEMLRNFPSQSARLKNTKLGLGTKTGRITVNNANELAKVLRHQKNAKAATNNDAKKLARVRENQRLAAEIDKRAALNAINKHQIALNRHRVDLHDESQRQVWNGMLSRQPNAIDRVMHPRSPQMNAGDARRSAARNHVSALRAVRKGITHPRMYGQIDGHLAAYIVKRYETPAKAEKVWRSQAMQHFLKERDNGLTKPDRSDVRHISQLLYLKLFMKGYTGQTNTSIINTVFLFLKIEYPACSLSLFMNLYPNLFRY